MERQVTFQTALFGGFHKKAVLKYIDELCEQNKAAEEKLFLQIAELEDRNKQQQQEQEQTTEQLRGLGEQAEQNQQKLEAMEQTVGELNQEISRQQRVLEEKDRELRAQQEKCRQLTLRAETLEYKGRKYDEAMVRIGDTFVEAQQNAQGIIKAAEQKASRMTLTTIESIQSIAEQLGTFQGDVAALRKALQASLTELEHRLEGIELSITTLDEAVKATQPQPEEKPPVQVAETPTEPVPQPQAAPTAPPKAQETKFFW